MENVKKHHTCVCPGCNNPVSDRSAACEQCKTDEFEVRNSHSSDGHHFPAIHSWHVQEAPQWDKETLKKL